MNLSDVKITRTHFKSATLTNKGFVRVSGGDDYLQVDEALWQK